MLWYCPLSSLIIELLLNQKKPKEDLLQAFESKNETKQRVEVYIQKLINHCASSKNGLTQFYFSIQFHCYFLFSLWQMIDSHWWRHIQKEWPIKSLFFSLAACVCLSAFDWRVFGFFSFRFFFMWFAIFKWAFYNRKIHHISIFIECTMALHYWEFI